MKEKIREYILKFLDIQPAEAKSVSIQESLSFENTVLKNRLWYRGDPAELDQFFKESALESTAQSRFWASVPSKDSNIRKIHSGLPGEIIDKLVDLVVVSMGEFIFDQDGNVENLSAEEEALRDLWIEIEEDNRLREEGYAEAIKETLIAGDGAFKISIDTELSEYPIIEYYSGERVRYSYKRGRLQGVSFFNAYLVDKKQYQLEEEYKRGTIRYILRDARGKEVPITTVPEIAHLQTVDFDGDFMMAIPMRFIGSAKFKNRGASILERKTDAFDALDEVISQWIDAIRAGRVKNYIPEDLLPKDPNTGQVMRANPFDNQFIRKSSSMKEGAADNIDQVQASINYAAFVESYANALDMCMQGVLSPSTLGIDLKKTDNALAQREKEKATLYTRSLMVNVLIEILPALVIASVKTKDIIDGHAPRDFDVSISFGEYAAPDFDSQIVTIGQARSYGIMSLEKAILELYGDSMTEEEREQEVKRIRAERESLLNPPEVSVDDLEREDEEPEEGKEIENES